MSKKDLFCIKTNNGYGLFQEYGSYPNMFNYNFYLVYYLQVKELSKTEIKKALQGEYYYERIGFEVWNKEFTKDKFINNPNIEFCAKDFGIDNDPDPYYGNCFITYLGKYDLPLGIELPKFSRQLDISYFTGKHKWYIFDEKTQDLVRNERGNAISFKKLNDEIKSYPRYYGASPTDILKRYNEDYRQTNDDDWEDMEMEEFYQEYPDMRPIKLKYEEVKFPLPVEEMRRLNGIKDEVDTKQVEYEQFCDKVEGLFLTFLNGIEEDKKSTQKHLLLLIKGLNILEEETGLINTMEAELLYDYIVKVLKSLRKTSLIEIIEDKREW